ncbi:MAG: glycosyltransferase family 39 protein, partial [Deltaproteobacteria bacterium]|nr:glycosyltransferase family 39 protein [Deltaproteobacteria bacterium]
MPLLPRLSPRAAAIAIAVGGCALLFVIPLATRSLTMADEGYLLLQSLDMANGKILYRDMDAFVTPGMWFLLAGLFKLVEPSVIASRVPVVIAYLALIALCYRIPARFGGAIAGMASVVIMMVSTVWAYPGWTFAFYSPFSMLAAIAALERLLAFHDSALRRDLALVGLLLGLSILFKQNYGTFALAGACLSLIVFRYEVGESAVASFRGAVSDALWLGAGIALIALPTVAYFGVHGALGDAFQSLVVHPFEFSGMHDIPYLDIGAFFAPNVLSETLDIMIYGA